MQSPKSSTTLLTAYNVASYSLFSAEMNQEAGMVRIVAHYKEQEMQSRLAYLLLDAGTSALRVIFDSIHPAVSLRDHLKQAHVKSVLQRLLQQVNNIICMGFDEFS